MLDVKGHGPGRNSCNPRGKKEIQVFRCRKGQNPNAAPFTPQSGLAQCLYLPFPTIKALAFQTLDLELRIPNDISYNSTPQLPVMVLLCPLKASHLVTAFDGSREGLQFQVTHGQIEV